MSPLSRVLRSTCLLLLLSLAFATVTATAASRVVPAHAAVADPVAQSPAYLVPPTADGQLPLVLETSPPYDDLVALVEQLGGRVLHRFEHVDGLAVTIPADRLEQLKAAGAVSSTRRQRYLRRAVTSLCPPAMRDRLGTQLLTSSDRFDPDAESSSFDPAPLRIVPVDPALLAAGAGTGGNSLSAGPGDGSAAAGDPGVGLSTFLDYDIVIGAAEVWETAAYGEGVIVCVIDTGVYPDHPLYEGNVIGGENLVPADEEEAIDANRDGVADGRSFDWDAIENHYHGTFVTGQIAGHADLIIDLQSTSPMDSTLFRLAESILYHGPETAEQIDSTTVKVRLFGTAPSASIYGIKVFPYNGGASPDARVAEALDHLISMKESGELDTDIINMSMGGPTLNDGEYFLDQLVDAATAAGMTVVVSAGNEGPAAMSVASPACAHTALAVGGTADPLHTRVGLECFLPHLPVGTGDMIYPYDELQMIDFSSRGPTADGRVGPDIVATAFLNFSATVVDTDGDFLPDAPTFGFSAGTSFSAPTVAGAAALLTAYARQSGRFDGPPYVANVLSRAARPLADSRTLSHVEQGAGFLDLARAFELMERGRVWHAATLDTRNRNQRRLTMPHGFARGDAPMIVPGGTYNFLVEVPRNAAQLEISFPEVLVTSPMTGDGVTAYVHTAKRGGTEDYVFIRGGIEPGTGFVYYLPEPGTMRIALHGGFTNWGPVSASVEVRATTASVAPDYNLSGRVGRDGSAEYVVEVPEGVAAMGAKLSWRHDWSRVPTYDLELAAEHADTSFAAYTLDSPELLLIEAPPAGAWTFRVSDAGTVERGREEFRLLVKFFDLLPPPDAAARLAVGGGVPATAGAMMMGATARPGVPTSVGAQPNPFNPSTDIRFELTAASVVTVDLYDVTGRQVRHLLGGPAAAGQHIVHWDGRTARGTTAASGVYFVQIETAAGNVSHKLVLAE